MSSSFFDPFEARMQFLSLLRKLNATQQSIQKVVSFAIKYGSRCGEDLWDCVLEECEKGSLNSRINVLYFLDSLCETTLFAGGGPDAPYIDFVSRDLDQITEFVVPPTREGVLNLLSAKQILETWRTKRVIRPDLVEKALEKLEERKSIVHSSSSSTNSKKRSSSRSHFETFSHADTLRRMEEDRERHKRLRERIWVLPISTSSRQTLPPHKTPNSDPSPSTPMSPAELLEAEEGKEAAAAAASSGEGIWGGGGGRAAGPLDGAVDLEFEQAWETTSDLNEDDLGEMEEENTLCFIPRSQRTSTRLAQLPSLPPLLAAPEPSTPSHSTFASANQPFASTSQTPLNPSLLQTPSAASISQPQQQQITPFQLPSLTITNPTPTGVDSRSPQPQQPNLPLVVEGTPTPAVARDASSSSSSHPILPESIPAPLPSPSPIPRPQAPPPSQQPQSLQQDQPMQEQAQPLSTIPIPLVQMQNTPSQPSQVPPPLPPPQILQHFPPQPTHPLPRPVLARKQSSPHPTGLPSRPPPSASFASWGSASDVPTSFSNFTATHAHIPQQHQQQQQPQQPFFPPPHFPNFPPQPQSGFPIPTLPAPGGGFFPNPPQPPHMPYNPAFAAYHQQMMSMNAQRPATTAGILPGGMGGSGVGGAGMDPGLMMFMQNQASERQRLEVQEKQQELHRLQVQLQMQKHGQGGVGSEGGDSTSMQEG